MIKPATACTAWGRDGPGGQAVGDGNPMRARILDAGERALRERGFFGVSIRQIAREVGVHPALIGHYFGDKMGMLSEIERLIGSRRSSDTAAPAPGSANEAPWAHEAPRE